MKYTIVGIAFALNLGANAQAADPVAADLKASATAQTASPVAVDLHAGTSGGGAQAASPVAVDLQAGAADGGTQTASAAAIDLQTDAAGGGAQAASPIAADPNAGTSGGDAPVTSPFAVELHAGTSGGGVQAEFVFNGYFTGRVSGDWLQISHSFNTINFDTIDIAYSGTADWATAGVFVDLHPLKDGWFVSGGAFQGNRNATFGGVPTNNVIIDGYTFTPADIGTVSGEAKLPSTSPFVGLGWDQAQHARSGMTFRVLAGAAFGGAKVTLSDAGPYSDTVPVQTWLAQEQAYAQSKAEPWKAYPVVQLGIGYRF